MFKTALVALYALLLTAGGAMQQNGSLYFLNHPETTRAAGVLGEFEVPAGTRGRVFFHFKNATGAGRTFTLTSDRPLNGVRMSSAVSRDATRAGAEAAHKFFTGKVRSARPFSISVYVPVGQVVSGVAEGTASESTRVKCQMGAGGEVEGAKVAVTPFLQKVFEVDVLKGATVSIGDLGVADNIGNYGVTHSIVVRNPSGATKKFDLVFSARGGPATVVYGMNGEYKTTGRIPAYGKMKAATVTVAAGKAIEVTTMPVGGVAYPLVIEVRPAKA